MIFKVFLGIRWIQGDNWFVLRDAIKIDESSYLT